MNASHVHVLINPNSGAFKMSGLVIRAIQRTWDQEDCEVTFQFSRSVADGRRKAAAAVSRGADVLLVCGGDGMINSIGCELLGTGVVMGVIPTGSGNGFARHFGIPLNPLAAVTALHKGRVQPIDVGVANRRPFFVTCSFAWEAALAEAVDKAPVRGILPYFLAGPMEYLEYRSPPVELLLDGHRQEKMKSPFLLTAANLTQFGGGARIAPKARADDGQLQLVMVERSDAPRLLLHFQKLFDGTMDEIPEVRTVSFRHLVLKRPEPGPIQIDGEPVAAAADVEIQVLRAALSVLLPVS